LLWSETDQFCPEKTTSLVLPSTNTNIIECAKKH